MPTFIVFFCPGVCVLQFFSRVMDDWLHKVGDSCWLHISSCSGRTPQRCQPRVLLHRDQMRGEPSPDGAALRGEDLRNILVDRWAAWKPIIDTIDHTSLGCLLDAMKPPRVTLYSLSLWHLILPLPRACLESGVPVFFRCES